MKSETLRPVARQLLRTYQVRSSRSKDLAEALSCGKLCSWSDGEKICQEREKSLSMFVILKGDIRVLREDAHGELRELVILHAPTMVGHMGLVDKSPRSATCIAKGHVGAISIDMEIFNAILSEASDSSSAFRHLLLASMTMQLSTANQKIRDLITDIEQGKLNQHQKEVANWREKMQEENQKRSDSESSSDRLMKIAGVLDGWTLETEGVEEVEFYEDEDMRRTREAREARKR